MQYSSRFFNGLMDQQWITLGLFVNKIPLQLRVQRLNLTSSSISLFLKLLTVFIKLLLCVSPLARAPPTPFSRHQKLDTLFCYGHQILLVTACQNESREGSCIFYRVRLCHCSTVNALVCVCIIFLLSFKALLKPEQRPHVFPLTVVCPSSSSLKLDGFTDGGNFTWAYCRQAPYPLFPPSSPPTPPRHALSNSVQLCPLFSPSGIFVYDCLALHVSTFTSCNAVFSYTC